MSGRAVPRWTVALNLSLLVLFPISWFAPLMRAGLDLPLFGTRDISVVTGLQSLWQTDVLLAGAVILLAILAPLLKTLGLALVHFGRLKGKVVPVLETLGKLAMADVFLIALYIVLAKGVALTRIETGWGLYLFTACILASIFVAHRTGQCEKRTDSACLRKLS